MSPKSTLIKENEIFNQIGNYEYLGERLIFIGNDL